MQVKAVVAKVKHAVTTIIDAGEEGEARLSITCESMPTPNEVHLLGARRCFKLLEDFIPPEVLTGEAR